MLDLRERRKGALPMHTDTPYNEIAFCLHEFCSQSPGLMWRMRCCGHAALARMTAIEMHEQVEGVSPVLEVLAKYNDPEIAQRANNQLAHV
jgi:hypothetical protein